MARRKIKLTWNNLKIMWLNCKRCSLYKHRKKVVFGKGLRNADAFLIGQAPGKTENILGYPFVGKIGRILRAFLREFNIDPEALYITNTVMCFPPKDRMPSVHEVKMCWPRLRAEIELVKPRFIIYCGMRAATICQLSEEYDKFFMQYYTYFMNHPGSIRRNEWRRDAIRKQIKLFAKAIRRKKGKLNYA